MVEAGASLLTLRAVTPCEGQMGQRWSVRGRGGQQRAYRGVVRDVAVNSSAAGEVGGGRAATEVAGGAGWEGVGGISGVALERRRAARYRHLQRGYARVLCREV